MCICLWKCFCKTFIIWPCKSIFKIICSLCLPIRKCVNFIRRQHWKQYFGFVGGLSLGQLYYVYLLRKIPFPYPIGIVLATIMSLILGLGNAVCAPLRCISLLVFPMYLGKPGRSVMKAIVLTCVVAGPIVNMALNAGEVVRVFGCSTQLSAEIAKDKYKLIARPFKNTLLALRSDIDQIKDTLRSIRDVIASIETEIEDSGELEATRQLIDHIDDVFQNVRRSSTIEKKYVHNPKDLERDKYQKTYLKKLEYRCHGQLSRAVANCLDTFDDAFNKCSSGVPKIAVPELCWPVKTSHICNVIDHIGGQAICDSGKQISAGLGEGYVYLQIAKRELTKDLKDIKLQYQIENFRQLTNIRDPKETGERVKHAFEEKSSSMDYVIVAVDVCVAVLFVRVVLAACAYHERYLTCIQHDNRHITGYFKTIDRRRRARNEYTLLPLKKMERSKYFDIHSLSIAERNRLVTQVLKVTLEVITATTFVMLDRLFFEALDVVRQHAVSDVQPKGVHDLEIEVQGPGMFASMVRKVLAVAGAERRVRRAASGGPCVPRPRPMPPVFFLKIYGGYLWILLLLYLNPYTMRLRRVICSWFYPRREKQRILHLYNDILKKRMLMQKTLRRKAVQAARAHYLSAESLLSLRIKFPDLLGWLRALPPARMTCLICGETEPRDSTKLPPGEAWHSCPTPRCPFVYCPECWSEVGERCLACDPSLAELSDVDSLSDDENPKY